MTHLISHIVRISDNKLCKIWFMENYAGIEVYMVSNRKDIRKGLSKKNLELT